MTVEELKQQYASMKKISYSSEYEFFKNKYSVFALSKISGEDLAIRLFANAVYGDKIGVRGYFCWSEHGDKNRGPVGTAKIGKTSNIQYDGTKYYITKNKTTTTIEKQKAIFCAENIKNIFINLVQIVKRYIEQNQLNNIIAYQDLKKELLNSIKNHNNIADENIDCIYNTNGFTAYVIKYFHCHWNNYFAFWYSKDSLLKVFKDVLNVDIVEEDSLVLNGQLSLFARDLGMDNDNFGVLLNKLKDEIKKSTSQQLSNEAKIRLQFFTKYLNYFLDYFNRWGVNKKYYGAFPETVRFKTEGGRLKDLEKSRATLNHYCGKLKTTWSKYCIGEWLSPFDVIDVRVFNPIMQQAQGDLDADTRNGYIWYLQFLKAVEMGLNIDDLNTLNEENNKNNGARDMNNNELNLILYGPPGTGKTYNTVRYAVAIIENKSKGDIDKEAYGEVFKRYKQYIKDERIAFTTFHQAYGYEEFIEGIKPILDEDDVKYDVLSGVFKKFCDNAKKLKTEVSTNYGFNSSPTVWKVSLEGTGDNPTRRDCLANNRIRIGWESYGKNLDNGVEIKDGKNVLGAFLNKMRIGDIVLSCYSATTVDAIGVVTGDYEWLDETFSPYRRSRSVKWLVKGIRADITEINNGKTMTLSSVYRLGISVDDVVKIINSNEKKDGKVVEYDYDTPYVFIIDEINRGNVSKIFGELITLIEPSKRLGIKENGEEMTCILPYSQDEFGVPKNVYILGTMNTADRSLVQLDAALRRRFAFKEMMPDPTLLNETSDGIKLNKLLTAINGRIEALLDREHQIGHSYFMGVKDAKDLAYIFEQKILPLLQEYFFDDYELIQKILSTQKALNENKVSSASFIEEKNNPFDSNKKIYSIKRDMPKDAKTYINIYDEQKTDTATE